MYKKIVALGTALPALLAAGFVSAEENYTEDVGDALQAMVDDIGEVIFTNLPVVFGVIAALMGLTFLVRYIRRWIGGARG